MGNNFRLAPEAVKDLPSVLSHGEFTKHFDLEGSGKLVYKAPVTELILVYFQPDLPLEQKSAATALVEGYVVKGLGETPGVEGTGFGWGLEDDFPVLDGDKDQKGCVLVVLVGWSSVEACVEARKSTLPEEFLGLTQEVVGVIALKSVLLRCRNISKGGDGEHGRRPAYRTSAIFDE